MHGGISYISHRYAKANNKYMKSYDKNEEPYYIMYLDADNLYGWAMSQPLPYSGFRWLPFNGTPEEWIEYSEWIYTGKGLILKFDLEYPEEKIIELHNDYPCAAERLNVSDMLSHYAKKIKDTYNISNGNVKKLIPTLTDKKE